MKNILLLLAFFYSITGYSFKYYQSGDSLFVWNLHGSCLRSAPSHDSKKVADLPYQSAIVVVEYDSMFMFGDYFEFFKLDTAAQAGWRNFWNMDNPPQIPSAGVKGYWVKVRFRGTEGYVSDVHLSRLPPFRYHTRQEIYEQASFAHLESETFREYATREFGLLETFGNDTLYNKSDIRYGRSLYHGGILNVEEGGSAWSGSTYILPGYYFEEGLLFVERLLCWEDPATTFSNTASSWAVVAYEEQQRLVLSFELAEVVVELKGSILVITTFSSC